VFDEHVSAYSEGPLLRDFLITSLFPRTSEVDTGNVKSYTNVKYIENDLKPRCYTCNNTNSTPTQDVPDIPVMLLFGWSEQDKLDLRNTRLTLLFFLRIVEMQGQLGVTIPDIQFWENPEDGFTGYMIFKNTQAYLDYRSNSTKFISLEEAIFEEKPTAKVRLVTAQKPEGDFYQIA
jgi:hypothetical protein